MLLLKNRMSRKSKFSQIFTNTIIRESFCFFLMEYKNRESDQMYSILDE